LGPEGTLPHIPRLRRYARLLTGDAARADDLVQDTLERACRKWSLWRPSPDGQGLRGWLLSIMHNHFLNQIRDQLSERDLVELDDSNQPVYDPFLHTPARLDLQQALAQLPALHREVVLLVCVEELTYAEAAQVLGVPTGTVMSRLSRGRESLRSLMEGAPTGAQPEQALHLKRVK